MTGFRGVITILLGIAAVAGAVWIWLSVSRERTLFELLESADTPRLLKQIDSGASLEVRDADGRTPLLVAMGESQFIVASAMLRAGADYETGDKHGNTPLIYAVNAGSSIMVRDLLTAGANVDAYSIFDGTPLQIAVQHDSREIVEMLLAAGADPNLKRGTTERPIQVALRNGDPRLVALLLEAGATVNAQSDRELPPIHLAARDPQLLALLMAAGADLGSRDWLGRTTLMHSGSIAAVEQLVAAGLSLEARDYGVWTPYLMSRGTVVPEVMDALVDASADWHRTAGLGWTVLFYVARDGPAEMVGTLVALGADLEARDAAGATPLMIAAGHGSVDGIQALIAAGADLDARDYDAWTPTITAGKSDPLEVLERLQTYDNVHPRGWTPLMYASRFGSPEAVRALLNAGANRNATASDGVSAMDLAALNPKLTGSDVLGLLSD